jgi:hypothetical protein
LTQDTFAVPVNGGDLRRVVDIAKKYGRPAIRMSLVLTKATISDFSSLKQYLEWAYNLGVREVVVRKMSGIDLNITEDNWVTDFYRAQGNLVSLEPLFREIDSDSDFQFVRQFSRYYYYDEIYKFKGDMSVVLTESDLDRSQQSWNRILSFTSDRVPVHEIVLEPNGVLSADYQQQRILALPEQVFDSE